MTENSVLFTIAFARDRQTTVYRDQAKLMLQSLVEFGHWKGPIIVFTNWADQLLTDELPFHVASRVCEVPVDFNDWSKGKEGKLPSARFRIQAWKHFDHWRSAENVLYMDTDCIVRRPLDPIIAWRRLSKCDIAGATAARRNMGRSKWFNGHITPEHQAVADRLPGVQSGTIVFAGGRRFWHACVEWSLLDRGPARDTHPSLITDQSSQNLLHLRSTHHHLGPKSDIMPPELVSCPHQGQRSALGHDTVNNSLIWHYWHLKEQQDRVVAMSSELDRLQLRGNHSAPPGLIGKWSHEKPKEKIKNVWEFHPDGLITVDDPAIHGRWEVADTTLTVDWLWGFEKATIPSSACPPTLHGQSFRNGHFTLTRA